MQRWAAIDILGGRVVSLRKGNPAMPIIWDTTPLEAARRWESEGASGLHVVDLDRAFETGANTSTVIEIIQASRIPVQVGGGMRTEDDALQAIRAGASRVVVGTMAFAHPEVLRRVAEKVGSASVVVAIDYDSRGVLTHGWRQASGNDVDGAVEHIQGLGLQRVIMTAVDRDGTSSGPDVAMYRKQLASRDIAILASGGIRSNQDLDELRGLGVEGAILGRAIYEGGVKMDGHGARHP